VLGLHHDSTVYDTDPETEGNTERRSVMHGTLAKEMVRRFMSTHDQVEMLKHFYGTGQTLPDGGGDDGGGEPPRCHPVRGCGVTRDRLDQMDLLSSDQVIIDAAIAGLTVTDTVLHDDTTEDDDLIDDLDLDDGLVAPHGETRQPANVIDGAMAALIGLDLLSPDDTEEEEEGQPLDHLNDLLIPLPPPKKWTLKNGNTA